MNKDKEKYEYYLNKMVEINGIPKDLNLKKEVKSVQVIRFLIHKIKTKRLNKWISTILVEKLLYTDLIVNFYIPINHTCNSIMYRNKPIYIYIAYILLR